MTVQIKASYPGTVPVRTGEDPLLPDRSGNDPALPEGMITKENTSETRMNAQLAAMEAQSREIMMNTDISAPPEKEDSTDKAALSEEARNRELTPEQRKALMSEWTLEMLGKEWLLLLNFMPSQGEDLSSLLTQLYELYHLLELAIVKNAAGPARQTEMTKLEKAFSAALNRVWASKMSDIISFFEKYGSRDQVSWLKSGTYYLASGERLPEKKLERFWQAGQEFQNKGTSVSPKGSYQAFTQKGVLYQSRGKEISFAAEPDLIKFPQEKQQKEQFTYGSMSGEMKTASSRTASGRNIPDIRSEAGINTAVSSGKGLFSAPDLQKASQFTKYFVKEGNVFAIPYFNSKNEELLGILSAITSMKCREFCTTSGMGKAMSNELQIAADNYIDSAIKKSSASPADQNTEALLQRREIYKTYYYAMEKYQNNRKAGMAILDGLKYAVEVFREKKLNAMFRQQRYGPEAGFFHSESSQRQDLPERMAADLRYGAGLLEKDWNDFLKYIGRSNERAISLTAAALMQKPRGTVLDPAVPDGNENTKNYSLFLVGAFTVLLLAVISAWILFR